MAKKKPDRGRERRKGGFRAAKKRRAWRAAQTADKPFREAWRARRPSKVHSYRPAFPGRSIFAEGATRTLCSFRSPPPGRFGPSAQVPTGHTLPSGAGRAGSLRSRRKHFLSIWRKRPAQPDFFDTLRAHAYGMGALFRHPAVTRDAESRYSQNRWDCPIDARISQPRPQSPRLIPAAERPRSPRPCWFASIRDESPAP